MKILQIGKFFPPYFYGGIETVSYALHEELQKKEGIIADFIGFLPKKYMDDIKVGEVCDQSVLEALYGEFDEKTILPYMGKKTKEGFMAVKEYMY